MDRTFWWAAYGKPGTGKDQPRAYTVCRYFSVETGATEDDARTLAAGLADAGEELVHLGRDED